MYLILSNRGNNQSHMPEKCVLNRSAKWLPQPFQYTQSLSSFNYVYGSKFTVFYWVSVHVLAIIMNFVYKKKAVGSALITKGGVLLH